MSSRSTRWSLVPWLADWFDEPFVRQLANPGRCCISELTRKHVTVALSGDGGDELFAAKFANCCHQCCHGGALTRLPEEPRATTRRSMQATASRSPRRRLRLDAAAAVQNTRRRRKMAATARARPVRAAAPDRPAENGLCRADRLLAARPAARLGGDAARPETPSRRRSPARRAGAARLGAAPRGHAQLAVSAVDVAHAAGLARAMGVRRRGASGWQHWSAIPVEYAHLGPRMQTRDHAVTQRADNHRRIAANDLRRGYGARSCDGNACRRCAGARTGICALIMRVSACGCRPGTSGLQRSNAAR